MAITKETSVETIKIIGKWNIEIATDTIIKEDDKEISRSRHRHIIEPYLSLKGEDEKWTHTDTDISKEASEVQAIANAIWTNKIKADYKKFKEAQEV